MAFLKPEEAQALMDAAAGDRLEALYIAAPTAGLRQGRLITPLARGGSGSRCYRGYRYSTTGQGRLRDQRTQVRKVPASGHPLAAGDRALKRHKAVQAAERLNAEDWEDLGLVFLTTGVDSGARRTSAVATSTRC